MRKPSRYVPLMVVVGVGAFMSFGWPLVAGKPDPRVHLDAASLAKLVAVHRGSADQSELNEFTKVKALIHFEALPATDESGAQGSFAVLREARVTPDATLLAALADDGSYATNVGGVSVKVRRFKGALHVLIGAEAWPTIKFPPPP